MPAARSPPTGDHLPSLALKSGRRPLHPKNLPHVSAINIKTKLKPVEWTADGSDKENVHRVFNLQTVQQQQPNMETLPMESLDASLADELMAIREKLERQRIDREKTDRALNERALVLDFQMKEILRRGEIQKCLEMEVDRLYRLKEIKLACLRVTPLRSLRDKEKEKKIKVQVHGTRSKDETVLESVAASDANGITAIVCN